MPRVPTNPEDICAAPVWVEAAVAVVLATLSFMAAPFVIGLVDQTFQIPAALRVLDPGLYPRDLIFLHASQEQFSLFPELVAALSRVVSLEGAYLLLAFGSRWGLAWSMLHLGRRVSGSLLWAVVPAAAALLIPFFAGGNRSDILEYVYPRSVTMVLVVAALTLLLARTRHRWLGAGLLLGAGFCMHALTALPGALILGLGLVHTVIDARDLRHTAKATALAGAGFLVASSPIWIRLVALPAASTGSLLAGSCEPQWWALISEEFVAYRFPHRWGLERLLFPGMCVLLTARALLERRTLAEGRLRPWTLAIWASVAGLTGLALLVAAQVCVPLLIKLQFGRSWYLLSVVGLPLSAWILGRADRERTPSAVASALLVVLGLASAQFNHLWMAQEVWAVLGANVLLALVLLGDGFMARRSPGIRLPRWVLPAGAGLCLLAPRAAAWPEVLGQALPYYPIGFFLGLFVAVGGGVAFGLARAAQTRLAHRLAGPALTAGIGLCCLGLTWMGEIHALDDVAAVVGVSELSTFAREETPADAVFALEESLFEEAGHWALDVHLRVHGRRSLWFAHLDKLQALYVPAIAAEWSRRRGVLQEIAASAPEDPGIGARLRAEEIDFLVTQRRLGVLPLVGVFDERFLYFVPRPGR